MGTKVQCKNYMPGFYSMRDHNEESNSCNWPLYYEDKSLTNGQYCNGFLPRVATEAYPGYDKDSVKQTMLEHEAIFKNQVYELHRLYRIQRDMMDGAKGKEVHLNRIQVGTSLSSSLLASQITSEDARRRTNHRFPMVNSVYDRPSTSVVDGIHSPLSSMEGTNMHAGPYSSQNGRSLKDIEALESRPAKVQRKLFDLQLPADEYIDTEEGEQVSNEKVSAISSSCPTRCEKNGVKFNGDDGRKAGDGKREKLNSDSLLRSPNGLADLNEPIELEDMRETNATSYDFCNGKIRDSAPSCKPNSQLLGLPKEISVNSYGSDIDTRSNGHLHNNGNGRGWFSHVPEVVQGKSNNVQSLPRFLQTELPHSSQQTQGSSSNVYEPNFYRSDKSKMGFWKDETVFTVDISKRTPDLTNSGPYQASSRNLAKPWSQSWEKPSGSFNQRPISAQTSWGLNAATVTNGSQASVRSDGVLGDRWYLNSNTRSAFGGESLSRNGFYQGSSLPGTKEQPIQIPSSSVDYLSPSNENDRAPRHFTNGGLAKYLKASNCVDTKPPKDMNLNVAISDSSSNQETPEREIKILGVEEKREDNLAALPWLRPKPACKNVVVEFGNTSKTGETSIIRSSTNRLPEDCSQRFAESVQSVTDLPSNKKLIGFAIFEKPDVRKNDTSSCTSLPVSFSKPPENKGVEKLNIILDMNLPCDPATPDLFQQDEERVVEEKVTEAKSKSSSFRHHIDLNACLSDGDDNDDDDGASLKPLAPKTRVNTMLGIDLEAPAIPEEEDEEDVIPEEESSLKHNESPLALAKCEAEVQDDDLIKVAAEAIVAISASICHDQASGSLIDLSELPPPPRESSLADPLAWFVEIVSRSADDLEGKLDAARRVEDSSRGNDEDSSEESDYFESVILQLRETREEDYMPATAPLVPEEETGPAFPTNRPRKGQSRRGRKRRDFQRDILPGLASLSRHEVTEDLQTFGGLMQAAGRPWQSGLTRRSSARNGAGRGRRRAAVSPPPLPPPTALPPPLPPMQMLNGVETGPEDRSLTGWGKTTRRPRRQRCAAGNPTSLPLNC